ATDADLLSLAERTDVDARMSALRDRFDSTDASAVREAIERLTQVTDTFAERRMDRSIRAALAGRKVEELLK
ncbi:MAG: Fe-S protein assembly chaperone HscA, partial [Burkholderiaceae bacterium]